MAKVVSALQDPVSFYGEIAAPMEFCRSVIEEPGFKVIHSRFGGGSFQVDGVNWHCIAVHCGASLHLTKRIDGRDHCGCADRHMSWIIPAGSRLSCHWKEAAEVLCLWLSPDRYDRPARNGGSIAAPKLQPRFPSVDPVVEHVALALKAGAQTGWPFGRLLQDGLIAALVAHLASEGLASPPCPPARGGLAGWRLRRVLDYIEEHLAEDMPLSELARLAGLSDHHFNAAFRQAIGTPPHRYVVGRRIGWAKELFQRDPTLSITEVALSVGFTTSNHFATIFRKFTGTTPRTYRESL
jgi:AraC family transcriptional regulator